MIIIGGGDTGADCLGTVHRQGCASVHQFEIVPRPPDDRPDQPLAAVVQRLPRLLGARGGGDREYSINTQRFLGRDGQVTA